MEYALAGLLIIFLVYLYLEARRKAQRVKISIAEEKRSIAEDSGMTAIMGVFSPDIQTTVIIGASEELGVFYYRMLKLAKVIIRSRINLANLAQINFMLNGTVQSLEIDSAQPTTSLQATEIADRVLGGFAADSIRQIQRAALRVDFYDESAQEKTLEITTFRASDERQKFERVQLIKNTVWWTAFLRLASRQIRRVRASAEEEDTSA